MASAVRSRSLMTFGLVPAMLANIGVSTGWPLSPALRLTACAVATPTCQASQVPHAGIEESGDGLTTSSETVEADQPLVPRPSTRRIPEVREQDVFPQPGAAWKIRNCDFWRTVKTREHA